MIRKIEWSKERTEAESCWKNTAVLARNYGLMLDSFRLKCQCNIWLEEVGNSELTKVVRTTAIDRQVIHGGLIIVKL